MSDMRSKAKTALAWTAGFLILLVLIHTLLIFATNERVDRELARVKARGEFLTTSDLAGPRVPDHLNGALLYEKAFVMMDDPALRRHVKVLEKFCSDDYSTKSRSDWIEAEQSLDQMSRVVAVAKQAAAKPRCRFSFDWSAGWNVSFKQNSSARLLSRVISVGAVVEAHRGNTAAAVELLELGAEVSRCLENEPDLICSLIYRASIGVHLSSVRAVMAEVDLGEPEARRLYDALGKTDLVKNNRIAEMGERVIGLTVYDQVRSRGWNSLGITTGRLEPVTYYGTYPLRPALNMDKATFLALSRRSVEDADLTCLEIDRRGIQEPRDTRLPRYACVTALSAPTWGLGRRGRDVLSAQLALTRIALALRAYRARYRAYPASLADLATRLGRKLSDDPFSGSLPKYRPAGSGYVLYSFGVDQKDDGGTPIPSSMRPTDPAAKGDIVWTVTR